MSAFIEFPFPTILQNLDTPVDDTDSATKGYVDEQVATGGGAVTLSADRITYAPEGNITSTDVQAAIVELDGITVKDTGGTIGGDLTVTGDVDLRADLDIIGDVVVGGNVSVVTAPTDPTHLVNKDYVDTTFQQGIASPDLTSPITILDYNGVANIIGAFAIEDGGLQIQSNDPNRNSTELAIISEYTDGQSVSQLTLKSGEEGNPTNFTKIQNFTIDGLPSTMISVGPTTPDPAYDGTVAFFLENELDSRIFATINPAGVINPTDLVTKSYIDGFSAGIVIHKAVRVAMTDPSNSIFTGLMIYDNGVNGVGATLRSTINSPIPGYGNPNGALVAGDRILFAYFNPTTRNYYAGVYDVTDAGAVNRPWVLTRSTDFDEINPAKIAAGALFPVLEGTDAGKQIYVVNDISAIGTDAIEFGTFSYPSQIDTDTGIGINVVNNNGLYVIQNTGLISASGETNQIDVNVVDFLGAKLASFRLAEDIEIPGTLKLQGNPVDPLEAATKQYVDAAVAAGGGGGGGGGLPLSGGTLTGPLTLSYNDYNAGAGTAGAAAQGFVSNVATTVAALDAVTVKTVNGAVPVNGDVAISLTSTLTGSLADLNTIPRATLPDGTTFIVIGDANPANDGTVFIWSTTANSGAGAWIEISPPGLASSDARYVNTNGDTMTGRLTLSADPIVALGAATKQYADTKLSATGGELTGNVTSTANLIVNNGAIYVASAAAGIESIISIGGDQIKVFTDSQPSQPDDDASLTTKSYVDNFVVDNFLQLGGGTLTGQINMNVAPTTANHVTTKTYVDTAAATKLSLTGGTMTGNLTLSGAAYSGVGDSLRATTKAYVDAAVATGSGSVSATAVAFGPTGNITAPNVQAALAELDTEKLGLAGGTMTGNITLAATGNGFVIATLAPTIGTHLTNKTYVDGLVTALDTTAVKSVNGVTPVAGAVTIALSATKTGTLAARPVSDTDGTIYVVSGDSTPANNGLVYIYSTNATAWIEISPPGLGSSDARYLQLAGGTMTGQINMNLAPTTANHVTTKTYVDTAGALKLNLAGGTLSGDVTSSANLIVATAPTIGTHLTNKTYVDTQRDTRLALTGGSITGNLAVSGNVLVTTPPTLGSHLVNRTYVEGQVNALATTINGFTVATTGTSIMTGNLNLGNFAAINLAAPVNANDAARKAYVDTALLAKLSTAGGAVTGNISMTSGANTATLVYGTSPDLKFHYETGANSWDFNYGTNTPVLKANVSGLALQTQFGAGAVSVGYQTGGGNASVQITPGSVIITGTDNQPALATTDGHVTTKRYVDATINSTVFDGGTY